MDTVWISYDIKPNNLQQFCQKHTEWLILGHMFICKVWSRQHKLQNEPYIKYVGWIWFLMYWIRELDLCRDLDLFQSGSDPNII